MSKLTGGISLLLALFISISCFSSDVSAAIEGDYEYNANFELGGAVITSYNGSATEIVIPKTLGGLPVVEIGMQSFFRKNLTHVSLPSTLRTIRGEAFEQNRLTSIQIPDGLKVIGASAFAYNQLTELTIPQSVTFIAPEAFTSNALTSLLLPSTLEGVGQNAFRGNSIEKVKVVGRDTVFGETPFLQNGVTSEYVTVYGRLDSPSQALALTYGYNFVPLFDLLEGLNEVTDMSYAVAYKERKILAVTELLPYDYSGLSIDVV